MLYYDIKEAGKRIKALRKAKKMTQEQLAERLGKSDVAIRMMESGKTGSSVTTLIGLAIALDTTIDYIVMGRNCVVVEEDEKVTEP